MTPALQRPRRCPPRPPAWRRTSRSPRLRAERSGGLGGVGAYVDRASTSSPSAAARLTREPSCSREALRQLAQRLCRRDAGVPRRQALPRAAPGHPAVGPPAPPRPASVRRARTRRTSTPTPARVSRTSTSSPASNARPPGLRSAWRNASVRRSRTTPVVVVVSAAPAVGSEAVQPIPGAYTSTQACASEAMSSRRPSAVARPAP